MTTSGSGDTTVGTGVIGGPAPQRDLHFIFLADCSGSMSIDGKIAQLNAGIEGAIPEMRGVVANRTDTRVLVRAIRFGDVAGWHVSQPTPLESFRWQKLEATGATAMGEAVRMATKALDALEGRQFPPALVLVTDGHATDDIKGALRELAASKWGQRAVRRAVAIGDDVDIETLRAFIGNPEVDPIQVSQPQDIAAAMRFVSVGTLSRASKGRNTAATAGGAPADLSVPGVPLQSGTTQPIPGGSPGQSPTGGTTPPDPSPPMTVF